ncbi:hypothetical protein D9757_001728 [Collybiopsis confluens]|uniref:Uncharacterized protein n=1 Tax=Collybiopsis confluens TaxID=2823264 RepID=A0A8H5HYG3_9AGAR|nr:hypothetical protein D9757_001728 [Collybiopsis confluens]
MAAFRPAALSASSKPSSSGFALPYGSPAAEISGMNQDIPSRHIFPVHYRMGVREAHETSPSNLLRW